ncbi:hypothetical protein PLICRDRAFT_179593 [Plicaturopsis crispa FD-325 SS-3]|uniref:Uncharacterized protein n=1 Tax=Plicaturopsis crispa FD-325 SS-3 TaxID=944288 RepID=A0A0C9T847_PLICR|nr:hypothetical protein PLICRDRAFT_179593 [Plicaturopsis crispa FD-325 SS-3]
MPSITRSAEPSRSPRTRSRGDDDEQHIHPAGKDSDARPQKRLRRERSMVYPKAEREEGEGPHEDPGGGCERHEDKGKRYEEKGKRDEDKGKHYEDTGKRHEDKSSKDKTQSGASNVRTRKNVLRNNNDYPSSVWHPARHGDDQEFEQRAKQKLQIEHIFLTPDEYPFVQEAIAFYRSEKARHVRAGQAIPRVIERPLPRTHKDDERERCAQRGMWLWQIGDTMRGSRCGVRRYPGVWDVIDAINAPCSSSVSGYDSPIISRAEGELWDCILFKTCEAYGMSSGAEVQAAVVAQIYLSRDVHLYVRLLRERQRAEQGGTSSNIGISARRERAAARAKTREAAPFALAEPTRGRDPWVYVEEGPLAWILFSERDTS